MKILIPAIAALAMASPAMAQNEGSDGSSPFAVEQADGTLTRPTSDYTFDLDDEGTGNETIYEDYEDAAPGEAAGLDVFFDLD